MAPKRKHDETDSDAASDAPKPKAKKAAKEPLKPLWTEQPVNRTFPPSLTLPARSDGLIRLATWNISGFKAADKKGLKFYVEAEDADILVLTETKIAQDPNAAYLNRFPHRYWETDPAKKGYAGVAILSKLQPKDVTYGLPTHPTPDDARGRLITLEFENHYVLGTYVPNAGEKLKNLDAKKIWNDAFETYLRGLDKKKPVLWLGDINCAQTEHDLRHSKPNWNKTPGYSQVEQDGLKAQLEPQEGQGQKLIDMWRHLHPDAVGHYTYFSYKFQCREKGIGWRLDTLILSERISERLKECEIRQTCYGASDHVPVYGDYDLKGEAF